MMRFVGYDPPPWYASSGLSMSGQFSQPSPATGVVMFYVYNLNTQKYVGGLLTAAKLCAYLSGLAASNPFAALRVYAVTNKGQHPLYGVSAASPAQWLLLAGKAGLCG